MTHRPYVTISALILSLGITSSAARNDSHAAAAVNEALMQRFGSAVSNADLVAAWNGLAYEVAFAEDQFFTFKGHRSFVMMHLAIHDSLNSIVPAYRQYAYRGKHAAAHPTAAAAQAAYEVLVSQYPDQQPALESELAVWLGQVQHDWPRARGIELGKAAAAAILALREGDGWDLPGAYEFQTEPGQYRTTPPWNGFVLQPGFRFARPFALTDPAELRQPAPPPLASRAYARAFREVKEYGAVNSARRSDDQASYALWWMEFAEGSVNRLARQLVAERGTHLWVAARLFAHLNMSLFDSYVATWDSKYEYNHWRPYTAIRAAGADSNDKTTADPDWEPLRPTPPFPEYVSAHAAACAATMTVLESTFSRNVPFTMATTTAPPGMPTRSFSSFRSAARECADSRVQLPRRCAVVVQLHAYCGDESPRSIGGEGSLTPALSAACRAVRGYNLAGRGSLSLNSTMLSDAKALFREVADRSPAEREEYYLRRGVPAVLRDEVESLLRFDDQTAGGLHGRVAAAARAALENPPFESSGTTREDDAETGAAASEIGEGRFPPGTLLADRYRVVSLLGRGGMGEVYRATDLKLKQPVALKFLPEAAARDPRLLARFHTEVRLARQISHPNVCRVYDIGELGGVAYISMEYIDGEDLASLLRRIGRLPHDKATEIARRLCAGLAAAHDKGVVHRDLKPGNVMIDSRGQVFITDFGLAATARDLAHTQLRSGTPAYMAPEQLEGREVSVRSDLYSLGLVLYEMFSGRPPFTHPRTPTDRPPRIDSVVKDVDTAVARTIERCLELAPRDRPSSALAVAASLPGGDPLAEALAAGVTPSPQMVAAAQSSEAISVRGAVLALAFALAGLPAMIVLGSRVSLLHVTPFPYPPQVLAQKAGELIESFGFTTPALDRHWTFFWNGFYQKDSEQNLPPAEYRAQLAMGQPSLVSFRYRQSQQHLLFFDPARDTIDEGDPPLRVPGDVFVSLDLHARLRHIEVVPTVDSYSQPSGQGVEWSRVFAAAGLDFERFTPARPDWIPPLTFDSRVAWTGTLTHSPSAIMRVEAASWRGRPVYFRLSSEPLKSILQAWYPPVATWAYLLAPWIVGAGALLVARRNHTSGRTDLRGASRLGLAIVVGSFLGWGVTAHHVATVQYVPSVFRALSAALTIGVLGAILYMAVEPFIRRRWPESLISWTRLLAGRLRDPLVGSHILAGSAFGIGLTLWLMLKQATLLNQGLVTTQDWRMLGGPGWMVYSLIWNLLWWSVVKALAICVLLLFAKVLLRRDWIAIAAAVLLANVVTILDGPRLGVEIAFELPAAAVAVWLLIRWGILPMMVASFIAELVTYTPLTTDFGGWYSGPTLLVAAIVLGLAIWSFSVAMAGRSLLEHELVERRA